MTEFNYDKLMQRIGEFVVCFQWIEDKFRSIGWLIEDPNRTVWPPRTLRSLNNRDLLNAVEVKYCSLMDTLNIDDADDRKTAFSELVGVCHEIRKFRNSFLHSAFIEVKAGREIMGILRSNPKLTFDPSTGTPEFDQEALTEESIMSQMEEIAQVSMTLCHTYTQLLHWAPFDPVNNEP